MNQRIRKVPELGGVFKGSYIFSYETNLTIMRSRLVILLIIFTVALFCVYVKYLDVYNPNSTKIYPASKFLLSVLNESDISSHEEWWEKMFCSNLNFFTPFYIKREPPRIMLDEFLIDVFPHKEEFKNIYMIENNCKSSLSWRMRCSMESVARANPNATLFIITISPHLEDLNGAMSKWLGAYPNIVPVRLNLNRLFFDTPLRRFSTEEAWTKIASFKHSHVSDAMRLALVWTSGGTYYDSDIIAIKGFPEDDNVYTLQHYSKVVGAFIKSKRHHPLLSEALEYFSKHYVKQEWDLNGPVLLTTIIQNYCQIKDVIPGRCRDITIVSPTEGIQPVPGYQSRELFRDVHSKYKINTSFKESFGVHFNNHITWSQAIYFERDTPFNRLIKEYCPLTYEEWLGRYLGLPQSQFHGNIVPINERVES